jgi:RNA polymerase sigma-70 factor (ECF subfamily)
VTEPRDFQESAPGLCGECVTSEDDDVGTQSVLMQGLLVKALAGDDSALGELLENHRAWLKLLTKRLIDYSDRGAIDESDIVQQTFIAALKGFDEFRGESPPEFLAWIRQVHRNASIDVMRRTLAVKRGGELERTLLDNPLARLTTPSQRMMLDEQAVELASAIARLPEDQQEAVRLRHLEGWSLADIARRMSRTEAAAAGLVKRGMSTLRQLMPEPD